MNRERTANESNARGASAEFLQSIYSRGDNLGIVRQPEIVVGGKNDDFTPPFHLHPRRLWRCQIIQALVDAVRLELLDRRVQIRIEFLIQCHLVPLVSQSSVRIALPPSLIPHP